MLNSEIRAPVIAAEPEALGANAGLGPLPEPAWFSPQWITEDAYSAKQMWQEKAVGSTEAMAQACNDVSAALGWPRGPGNFFHGAAGVH